MPAPRYARESRSRVFFALMPPASVAAEIGELTQSLELAGQAVSTDRLHLTLAFIGNVDDMQIDTLLARGDAVQVAPFTLTLDHAGGFARAGINWLAPSEPPQALPALSRMLYKNTHSAIDDRRFRPHITIERKAAVLETRSIIPIRWPVTDFSLIASGVNGAPGAYRELRRWPLLPASAEAFRL